MKKKFLHSHALRPPCKSVNITRRPDAIYRARALGKISSALSMQRRARGKQNYRGCAALGENISRRSGGPRARRTRLRRVIRVWLRDPGVRCCRVCVCVCRCIMEARVAMGRSALRKIDRSWWAQQSAGNNVNSADNAISNAFSLPLPVRPSAAWQRGPPRALMAPGLLIEVPADECQRERGPRISCFRWFRPLVWCICKCYLTRIVTLYDTRTESFYVEALV